MVGRALAREELHQAKDLEAGVAQDLDELTGPDVELDLGLARPLEAVHPALRPLEARRHLAFVRHAQHRERRVAEEYKLPASSQQPRGFGDPLVRIAPDRRAVLGDREIERPAGQRDRLGVRFDELDVEGGPLVHTPRGRELRRSDVDADAPAGAAPLQPRGDVRGATAELDDVLAADVREDLELALRRVPDAPRDLGLVPGVFSSSVGVVGVRLRPVIAIDPNVIGFLGAHPPAAT